MQAKENNFKAVLESIRDLMNEDCVLPPWLHDIMLGYGDPGAAQYKHMDGCLQTVDFKDTFLDAGESSRQLYCQGCLFFSCLSLRSVGVHA